MNTTCSCGCGCGDLALTGPQPIANRPGLPALAYRVGTHASFLQAMIDRLSSADFPALAALTTRDPADPSIALLDSWALVADVLTFYQERIANEGYLRTATERRSILELARLIGYRLRPGVAASVFLAYTLDEDRSKTPPAPTETLIPAGSRSQSVPGPGQKPQPFETSADLDARSAWNLLGPRLTQPQLFTLGVDFGTDVGSRDAVYFAGTAANLNPGDPLLFVLGPGTDPTTPQQGFRLVQSVETQPAQNRTEIILQPPPTVGVNIVTTPAKIVIKAVTPFVADAASLFGGTKIAVDAGAVLSNPPPATPPGLLEQLQPADGSTLTADDVVALAQRAIARISALHDLAVSRKFTRLEPWLSQLIDTLNAAIRQVQTAGAQGQAVIGGKGERAPLSSLLQLLPSLTLPPSLQPANTLRLARSVGGAFAAESDMGPRMIGTFLPSAAPILYQAWVNIQTATTTPLVGPARFKAGLFPGTYPGLPTSTTSGGTTTTSFPNPPTIAEDWPGVGRLPTLNTIFLDSICDKIVAGSWIMIDRPGSSGLVHLGGGAPARRRTFHQVTGAAAISQTTSDQGFTAKITQLTIDPPWLADMQPQDAVAFMNNPAGLTGTVVYAQTEPLALAEEPLDADIEGDTIELDEVYQGLESGRWIIVSGERTDIPDVTGVTGSELVMILSVAQATHAAGTRAGAIHTVLTLANKLAYTYDRGTVSIYGNVVKATHGETRSEVLGNGDGSQAFPRFSLKQKPLTFVPDSSPDGIATTLAVAVNSIKWREIDTLAAAGPRDHAYVVQIADDDTATVVFGNGTQGARLPTGTGNVSAVYRNGIGQPGNVDAGQISLLQTRPLNVKAVINPLRASGGADRDTRDQARRNAPYAVMALDRLVSVEDYADFARAFAGIGKASAARLSDGHRELVHVTIAGAADIPIDPTSDLYTNLVQALAVNGDPYQPLVVAVRRLRLLVISARVRILPDRSWEPVATALRATLLAAFGFAARDLGQPVFASEVIAALQAVDGVDYVDLQVLDSVPEDITAQQLAGLAGSLGSNPFVPASLAGPNPAPADPPADAILAAEIVYLSPALPDTLILNQVTP